MICGLVKGIRSNFWYNLFNMYGLINNRDNLKLWIELEESITIEQDGLSIIGQGFNDILCPSEKEGGKNSLSLASKEFYNWVNRQGLMEITCSNNTCT